MEQKEIYLQNTSKLMGLEIIRFISAVAVLFWHYQHFSFFAEKPVNFIKEHQPFYFLFGIFYNYGYYGVQIFWSISGFIFYLKYKDIVADKMITGWRFFILRFSRLYPLHIVTLLLVAFLQFFYFKNNNFYFVYQDNDLKHFIYQLFLASSWGFDVGGTGSFNGPIWSISVEVLAYCFFFFALRFFGKSALINIAVILACITMRFLKIPLEILNCLAFFYIGGLTAQVLQYIENTKYKKPAAYYSCFLVLLIPSSAYIFKLYELKGFVFIFVTLYTPLLIYFAAQEMKIKPNFQKVIEIAGNMTYSSYLIHFPLQLAIVIYFNSINKKIPVYEPAFFSGFIIVTLLASILIYRYFELPAQKFIRKKIK